jgi:hypothetical protein
MSPVMAAAMRDEFVKIALEEKTKNRIVAALLPIGVTMAGSGSAAAVSPFLREAIERRLGAEGVRAVAKSPLVAGGAATAGLGLLAMATNAALRHQMATERARIEAGIPWAPVRNVEIDKAASAVDALKVLGLRAVKDTGLGAATGAGVAAMQASRKASPEDRVDAAIRAAVPGAAIGATFGLLAGVVGTPAAIRTPMANKAISEAVTKATQQTLEQEGRLTLKSLLKNYGTGLKTWASVMRPLGVGSHFGEAAAHIAGIGLARQKGMEAAGV